jgi:hypothetical protein
MIDSRFTMMHKILNTRKPYTTNDRVLELMLEHYMDLESAIMETWSEEIGCTLEEYLGAGDDIQ